MDNPTAWWILAGFFVAMELVSGTFYLLMLAVGAVAGALAAHAGLSMPWHWVAFTVVGGGAVIALYLTRRIFGKRTAADVRHDNLDLGDVLIVIPARRKGHFRVARIAVAHVQQPLGRNPLGQHRTALNQRPGDHLQAGIERRQNLLALGHLM